MATYKIDPSHSEIGFKVKHLVITTVSGHFSKFDGTVISNNPDFTDAEIDFEIDVDSISTKNEQRDTHLKSPDFFDAAQFQKITFHSTSIEKKSEQKYIVNGDLSLHGVTKQISLDADFNGSAVFYGQNKVGFEIMGKINRKDFGLTWNALTESGGFAVSEDVRLEMNVELIEQA